MKATVYKKKIKAACVAAGTYREFFDSVIAALSEILQKRDEVMEQYVDELDAKPIITYTNKAGASNPTKNPALVLWDDLNKSALSYWRDLGLTPAGLKKIDEQAMKKKKVSSLAEALKSLE